MDSLELPAGSRVSLGTIQYFGILAKPWFQPMLWHSLPCFLHFADCCMCCCCMVFVHFSCLDK
jgi:hypothetical protein